MARLDILATRRNAVRIAESFPGATTAIYGSWISFEKHIRSGSLPWHIIVERTSIGSENWARLSSLPAFLWWWASTADDLEAVLASAAAEGIPVLFEEHAASPIAMDWQAAHQAAADGVGALRSLAPRILAMPRPIAVEMAALFASSHCATSVKQLVARTGSSRRTIDRWLSRLKLASARHILVYSRILRMQREVSGGKNLQQVARRYGAGTPRALRRQLRGLGLAHGALVPGPELLLRG